MDISLFGKIEIDECVSNFCNKSDDIITNDLESYFINDEDSKRIDTFIEKENIRENKILDDESPF